ncbi:MAG: cobyrinate a,c-diamide synthase [bacterium]
MVFNPGGEGKQVSSPARGKLLVGGLRGSSGKTIVTLGLIGALKNRGVPVTAFKKGPDYIDAAWHSRATGSPCYCLDVYLMGPERTAHQFMMKSPLEGVAVIEGNRGLFDGFDEHGSYSTAELSKLLSVPVILVVDVTKCTRTAAALVLGCTRLDPAVRIAGVVLNRVAGDRHERVVSRSIEEAAGVPVVGAVPKLAGAVTPERHLGLVTPEETLDAEDWITNLGREIAPYLDVDRMLEFGALPATRRVPGIESRAGVSLSRGVKIGVVHDSAFPFYYPENLEALEREGAELIYLRAVDGGELPDIDALYVGGGFPETHAELLSGNHVFKRSLRERVESGLPVYAECGGAILLGRRIYYRERWYEMAGVLPLDFEFCDKPQGHGYTEWEIESENPFYEAGTRLRGHEFHYTRAVDFSPERLDTVCRVLRGSGFGDGREGVRVHNVAAFYGHVHALGSPEWARGLVKAAGFYSGGRTGILYA